jgi:hypothetical protein
MLAMVFADHQFKQLVANGLIQSGIYELNMEQVKGIRLFYMGTCAQLMPRKLNI